jgi:chemotaxis protein MotB
VADDDKKRPIIKKVIKVQAAGHHGGAWKVAYADFATAMMAFFMLMWLLNVAPPETLAGLADYFTPSSSDTIGSPNPVNNRIDRPGQNPSPIATISIPGPPPSGEDADGKEKGGEGQREMIDFTEIEDQSFEQMQEQLRLAIQQSPTLQEMSENLIMEITEDGMKIQLIDKDRRAMFRKGSDELYQYAVDMLREIGRSVQTLPNRITVLGHTDGGTFTGKAGDTNWELSADRANSARRVLGGAGVTDDRVYEVTGKAGTDPLYPDQPNKIENRRITILVLREAPVVPRSLLGGN